MRIDRAHNNYIDTAFSVGLIGLGTYLAVIVTFLYHLFNLLKRSEDKSRKILYAGIISGYCGYLINDIFIFSVVSASPIFWSFMGITVAVGRINYDDFVKSPSAALCFIFSHSDVPLSTPHS